MLKSSEWARRGDSTATLPMASHKSDTSAASSEETQTDSEPFRSSEVPGFDEADSAQPGTKRGPQSSGPAGLYLKRPKRPGSVIGLRELIEAGFLEPGKDVLSLTYKQITQLASLEPDGAITTYIGDEQLRFESPSGFSIYIKRLVFPGRKADDGWKSVRYGSQVLDKIKTQYILQRFKVPAESGQSEDQPEPDILEPKTSEGHSEAA